MSTISYKYSNFRRDNDIPTVFIYIIGNQINTAQSQSAWEMMMAPSLSGKNLYASPHTAPAIMAAMMSMKLNFEICTRL